MPREFTYFPGCSLHGTGLAYDRPPGPPLSEVGLAEARLAGQFLAGRDIQRLYASPLQRALGTAQAISAAIGVAPDIEAGLYFGTAVLILLVAAWLLLDLVYAPRPPEDTEDDLRETTVNPGRDV